MRIQTEPFQRLRGVTTGGLVVGGIEGRIVLEEMPIRSDPVDQRHQLGDYAVKAGLVRQGIHGLFNAWPKSLAIVTMSTPFMAAVEAQGWRRSCGAGSLD